MEHGTHMRMIAPDILEPLQYGNDGFGTVLQLSRGSMKDW
jgi:hypothetical protein